MRFKLIFPLLAALALPACAADSGLNASSFLVRPTLQWHCNTVSLTILEAARNDDKQGLLEAGLGNAAAQHAIQMLRGFAPKSEPQYISHRLVTTETYYRQYVIRDTPTDGKAAAEKIVRVWFVAHDADITPSRLEAIDSETQK